MAQATLYLYATDQCVYSARIRMVLNWLGIPYTELSPLDGSVNSTRYQKRVPAGEVPAIEQGDFVLHDAMAIIHYLDDIETPVFRGVQNRQSNALIHSVVQYHDRHFEPVIRSFCQLVGKNKTDKESIAMARDRFFDGLFRLDHLLGLDSFLLSTHAHLLHVTIPISIYLISDIAAEFEMTLVVPDNVRLLQEMAMQNCIVADQVRNHRGKTAEWLQLQRPLKLVRSSLH